MVEPTWILKLEQKQYVSQNKYMKTQQPIIQTWLQKLRLTLCKTNKARMEHTQSRNRINKRSRKAMAAKLGNSKKTSTAKI